MNKRICIITPALADANNGNWQTASRWDRFLRAGGYRTALALKWDGCDADLLIALHARRSAQSVEAFAAAGGWVVLVLTGTDLYRDIQHDPAAIRSLHLAQHLVLLQPEGMRALPPELHTRTSVIFQSATALKPWPPRVRSFDLVMVGHARPEKDPLTALRALAHLDRSDPRRARLRLLSIGGDRDAALFARMGALARADSRIHLLGALPHASARAWIRRAQALLLPSLMEGGANVLIEAVTSDVPVLASRIDGSVGMLGTDYEGYFETGDDAGLAEQIVRLQDDPAWRARLLRQCRARAPLFTPQRERAAVLALVSGAAGR